MTFTRFTADEIETIVNEINLLKQENTRDQIDQIERFHEFKTQNKIFYDLIISDVPFDMVIFKQMMKMKRKLEGGEEQFSVDVKFGEFMAEKYLKPIVDQKEQKQ